MLLLRKRKVRQTLVETKRLLNEGGWIKGLMTSGGKYCLVGAVIKAGGENPKVYRSYSNPDPVIEATLRSLRNTLDPLKEGGIQGTLIAFNDYDAKTLYDMNSLIDKAIKNP